MPNQTDKYSLRQLIFSKQMEFMMEAHSPLAAIISEKIGFQALWASGLSISTLLGMRDCNEISSDQLLNIIELMSYSVNIPILVDGDTGFGNFNNARIFVKKLCSIGIGGVCFEDKVFPKKNSFIEKEQLLAPIEEFCGKIKACKDYQSNEDFILVARTEALVAGKDNEEALIRAHAYVEAGADAVLIHSKLKHADEIIQFAQDWNQKTPLIAVPTTYYNTPVRDLEISGVNNIIWANHNIRSCFSGMMDVASQIYKTNSASNVENKIASVKDIFNLLDYKELEDAELKYMNHIKHKNIE